MTTKAAGDGLNVRKEERKGTKKEKREGAVEVSAAAARRISAMRCED